MGTILIECSALVELIFLQLRGTLDGNPKNAAGVIASSVNLEHMFD